MTQAQLKPAPGFDKYPDHKMVLSSTDKQYEMLFGGKVIAKSARAVFLEEANYQGRLYFPLEDVEQQYLNATDTTTYCPFKGTANYWSIDTGDQQLENGVWGYLEPFAECADIQNFVCFYTEKGPFELREF